MQQDYFLIIREINIENLSNFTNIRFSFVHFGLKIIFNFICIKIINNLNVNRIEYVLIKKCIQFWNDNLYQNATVKPDALHGAALYNRRGQTLSSWGKYGHSVLPRNFG